MAAPTNAEELVCAGEFFMDFVFFGLKALPKLGEEVKTDAFASSPGGGAAITAMAAARLGRPAELVTVWGDSMVEAEARRRLEASGVSFGCSRIRPGAEPGVTVAVSTRKDRYFITSPGANRFVAAHLVEAETLNRIGQARHVHFALVPDRWEPFLNAIKRLRRGGTTVSWDLGWDPAAGRSADFQDLRRQLDVLFLNEAEALRYADARSPQEALAHFASSRNTVVIKRSAAGAMACSEGGTPAEVAGIEVDAVETTGAGDAFNGGFLHAWMAGKSLEDALWAGNICGGLSTRAAGGVQALPTRAEFERHFGSPVPKRTMNRGTG